MSDQDLRNGLIRLAHANPELRPTLLPLLVGGQVRAAGTLRYEGDTALDKVYAMSDLLSEVIYHKGPTVEMFAPEVKAVRNALRALEQAVEKAVEKK